MFNNLQRNDLFKEEFEFLRCYLKKLVIKMLGTVIRYFYL